MHHNTAIVIDNRTSIYVNDDDFDQGINWNNLLFVVGRHPSISYIQFLIALYGLLENLFYLYLSYEGNLAQQISNVYFLIDLICVIPWIFEVNR